MNHQNNQGDIPDENIQTDTERQKLLKKYHLWAICIMAVLIVVLIVLLLSRCSNHSEYVPSTENSRNPQTTETQGTEATALQGTETQAFQESSFWSEWTDTLPENISSENYSIEQRLLYRSRTLEKTTSTETDSMEGWELYDTVKAGDGWGNWSDWSANAVTASDTRQVETQTRYRYRNKETTTGSSSSMSGWTLYDTKYSWGNYGAWSSWSTTSVSGSSSRQVESKTQYRYRSISYSTEYTSWSSWSDWTDTRQSTSDLKKEESRTVYPYYYFYCTYCGTGARYPYHGVSCEFCGRTISGSTGTVEWFDIPWENSTPWGSGTGKYYQYIHGYIYWNWTDGSPKTQYRYATRSTRQVTNYGSWSSWGDTAYSKTSSRDVETRTVYRYRDRSQIATYYFWRWGNWSGWSTDKVTANNDRQVENAVYYRYRDAVFQTTYYFRRWSDWSDYTDGEITPSEEVEVETKTQYRYKFKTG